MKLTKEYDMNDCDDARLVKLELHVNGFAAAIDEIKGMFRSELKYNEKLSDDQILIVDKLQNKLFEIISDLPEVD